MSASGDDGSDSEFPPVRIEYDVNQYISGILVASIAILIIAVWLLTSNISVRTDTIIMISVSSIFEFAKMMAWRYIKSNSYIYFSSDGFEQKYRKDLAPTRYSWDEIEGFVFVRESGDSAQDGYFLLKKEREARPGFSPEFWEVLIGGDLRRVQLMSVEMKYEELVALLEKYRRRFAAPEDSAPEKKVGLLHEVPLTIPVSLASSIPLFIPLNSASKVVWPIVGAVFVAIALVVFPRDIFQNLTSLWNAAGSILFAAFGIMMAVHGLWARMSPSAGMSIRTDGFLLNDSPMRRPVFYRWDDVGPFYEKRMSDADVVAAHLLSRQRTESRRLESGDAPRISRPELELPELELDHASLIALLNRLRLTYGNGETA